MRTRWWVTARRHRAVAVIAFVAAAAALDGTPAGATAGKALGAALAEPSRPTATHAPAPSARPSPAPRSATGALSAPAPRRTAPDEEKHDGETTPPEETDEPAPDGPAWTPTAPLPPYATDSSKVDVVLTPHPDDETLSFGVWIANAVARGHRVVVVSLTDGRSTGAIHTVSAKLGRAVTRDQIAAARIRELRAAAGALGVAPGDVYTAACDAERSQGGTRLTVPEARAVVDAFAEHFPRATFATMSWSAERHADHLAAGAALREAAETGTVQHSVFAVSRLWWTLKAPAPVSDVRPVNKVVRRRVLDAAADYQLWAPARQRYSVGWLSVRRQFVALAGDPRDRIHPGPKPIASRTEP